MADYKVTDTELTSVANAIRTKGGTSAQLEWPSGFTTAIGNISGGGVQPSTDYVKRTTIVPLMASNTQDGFVASASSTISSDFAAYKAFDSINTGSGMQGGWLAAAADNNPWIMLELPSAMLLDSVSICTANNGASKTIPTYIEGKTANDEWVNILPNSQTIDLEFIKSTSGQGKNVTKHDIPIICNNYTAIKITGTDKYYYGANNSACTFDYIELFAKREGMTLPGTCYYTENIPDNGFGENGNICVDVYNKIIYQKKANVWSVL